MTGRNSYFPEVGLGAPIFLLLFLLSLKQLARSVQILAEWSGFLP